MPSAFLPRFEFAPGRGVAARAYFAYETAADALFDPRGRIVRCAPWRRTVMHELPDGSRAFCKFRRGRHTDRANELRALDELRSLGLRVPALLFTATLGADSVLGLAGVPGRPVECLLAEGRELDRVCREMPEVLRRLHGAGWVYRDMYWNHVFAETGGRGLWLIDVERAFRPGARFERWRVKDLAGLLSSLPAGVAVSRSAQLRFLRDSLGGLPGDLEAVVREILAKVRKIRRHVTKYPG